MVNIQRLYLGQPVDATNTKSTDKFLEHDLNFPIKIGEFNKVKTEFTNKDLANMFENKNVDVFGVKYTYQCIYSNDSNNNKLMRNACIYGGVTYHSDDNNNYQITVPVTVNGHQNYSFTINTKKDKVTAQELDYKIRNYLTKEKHLYTYEGSAYETGYVKFIEKNGESFWYDVFPKPKTEPFDPSRFLMFYNDNNTLESNSLRVEVHLTTR